jgi:hypothetical protein
LEAAWEALELWDTILALLVCLPGPRAAAVNARPYTAATTAQGCGGRRDGRRAVREGGGGKASLGAVGISFTACHNALHSTSMLSKFVVVCACALELWALAGSVSGPGRGRGRCGLGILASKRAARLSRRIWRRCAALPTQPWIQQLSRRREVRMFVYVCGGMAAQWVGVCVCVRVGVYAASRVGRAKRHGSQTCRYPNLRSSFRSTRRPLHAPRLACDYSTAPPF